MDELTVARKTLEATAKYWEPLTEPWMLVIYERPGGPPGNQRVPLTGILIAEQIRKVANMSDAELKRFLASPGETK